MRLSEGGKQTGWAWQKSPRQQAHPTAICNLWSEELSGICVEKKRDGQTDWQVEPGREKGGSYHNVPLSTYIGSGNQKNESRKRGLDFQSRKWHLKTFGEFEKVFPITIWNSRVCYANPIQSLEIRWAYLTLHSAFKPYHSIVHFLINNGKFTWFKKYRRTSLKQSFIENRHHAHSKIYYRSQNVSKS